MFQFSDKTGKTTPIATLEGQVLQLVLKSCKHLAEN
jgi:hypothetical protein